jgi:hypothetical protein
VIQNVAEVQAGGIGPQTAVIDLIQSGLSGPSMGRVLLLGRVIAPAWSYPPTALPIAIGLGMPARAPLKRGRGTRSAYWQDLKNLINVEASNSGYSSGM